MKIVMCIHALHYAMISILYILFLCSRYGHSLRSSEFILKKIRSQHNYGGGGCKVGVAAQDYNGRYPLSLSRPRTNFDNPFNKVHPEGSYLKLVNRVEVNMSTSGPSNATSRSQ